MTNASNEGICVEFCRKIRKLPTLKMPASTKNLLRLTSLILFLTISV